jgi:molybdopterin converting factor subunit 1
MIRVHIKLFAALRQAAGWSERTMMLPEGAQVGAALEQLAQEYPGLDLAGRTVYAAVNQEYARSDRLLADGDVVAIFPPVSGG